MHPEIDGNRILRFVGVLIALARELDGLGCEAAGWAARHGDHTAIPIIFRLTNSEVIASASPLDCVRRMPRSALAVRVPGSQQDVIAVTYTSPPTVQLMPQ